MPVPPGEGSELSGGLDDKVVVSGISSKWWVAAHPHGPVLAVTAFDTEDEAITLANNTTYGLASSIYTADLRRAHRVAASLRSGTVSVNGYSEGGMAGRYAFTAA